MFLNIFQAPVSQNKRISVVLWGPQAQSATPFLTAPQYYGIPPPKPLKETLK